MRTTQPGRGASRPFSIFYSVFSRGPILRGPTRNAVSAAPPAGRRDSSWRARGGQRTEAGRAAQATRVLSLDRGPSKGEGNRRRTTAAAFRRWGAFVRSAPGAPYQPTSLENQNSKPTGVYRDYCLWAAPPVLRGWSSRAGARHLACRLQGILCLSRPRGDNNAPAPLVLFVLFLSFFSSSTPIISLDHCATG